MTHQRDLDGMDRGFNIRVFISAAAVDGWDRHFKQPEVDQTVDSDGGTRGSQLDKSIWPDDSSLSHFVPVPAGTPQPHTLNTTPTAALLPNALPSECASHPPPQPV